MQPVPGEEGKFRKPVTVVVAEPNPEIVVAYSVLAVIAVVEAYVNEDAIVLGEENGPAANTLPVLSIVKSVVVADGVEEPMAKRMVLEAGEVAVKRLVFAMRESRPIGVVEATPISPPAVISRRTSVEVE